MNRSIADWGGNIAAFLAVLTINGLANALPIGGQSTGQVSAKYGSLFTPAGFTFSIWGLIYLALLAFVVYQALPTQRSNERLAQVGLPFKLNCLCNAVWIFAWHYDQVLLSLALMLGILLSLIVIYRGLGDDMPLLVRFPFSLYTGWITVATIANISALQTALDLNDVALTAVQWTWVKLAAAGAIGAIVVSQRRDPVYILVIAWAALGIAQKQVATPEVSGAAATLSMLAALLAVYVVYQRLIKR